MSAVISLPEMSRPTRRDERWKYTQLASVFDTSWQALPAAQASSKSESGYHISLQDNQLYYDADALPAGVCLELVEPMLVELSSALYSKADHYFAQQTQVGPTIAFRLSVAENVVVTEPLLIQVLLQDGLGPIWQNIQWHIDVAEGAELSLQWFLQDELGQPRVTNWWMDVRLAERARLNELFCQRFSTQVSWFKTQQVTQAAESYCQQQHFALGAALARMDSFVQLLGEHACCDLQGLYHVNGQRQSNHYITVEHEAPRTSSTQCYKGLADDAGHGVFNSKVIIRDGSEQSLSGQTNHNLLLSSRAEIDTKPDLEIYTEEVQSAHGSTVGSLDEQALFYLQARGIAKPQASAMLMQAFALELVERVLDEKAKAKIESAVLTALGVS